MSTLSPAAKLGMSMRFQVTVDGIDLGSWSSCAGLAVDFTHVVVKEGANYEHPVILPDRVEYKAITLRRAMSQPESAQVQAWLAQVVSGWYNASSPRDYGPRTAHIQLYDATWQGLVSSWTLRNVYPARWSGPDLDATGTSVAIEQLQLVHEGFL
ncbi:phage tail protein [Spirilliplanes yamanashiensis]|uniref:Phage tail protein n=1 Tax=Spirilliplanes yamanashiensis TaxID=42233 RepID=A0A8J4DJU9_9ACTN|nr:phage tail protein [Spirilliplanes yamanashiensis]MDP9815434.1 phage tail-like protein [Spirilliplanes yamanashiensis]GIJ03689.1 phage tail protein [Spirilliplanes yamanashiensis]